MTIKEFIKKYDCNVPRYTSYPTANHFSDKINSSYYQKWISGLITEKESRERISLYIHVPFCASMCSYCACHTRITDDYNFVKTYVDSLIREIETISFLIGYNKANTCKVGQIHWGGGTPTYLKPHDIKSIFDAVNRCFDLSDIHEHAMEIDPRTVNEDIASCLQEIGVNRVSMGIQDMDTDVQKAINRIQPAKIVEKAINSVRKAGIDKLNFDLIYGLPLQTEKSVKNSTATILQFSPSRLSVFGYAHVPWFKKNQDRLNAYDLPDSLQRYDIYRSISQALTEDGYKEIGIDHFAKENDELYDSYINKTMRRNFQGYTPYDYENIIAFGASAIGKTAGGYVQNTPMIGKYTLKAGKGLLTTCKGVQLTDRDRIISKIIEEIMCFGEVDISVLHDRQAELFIYRMTDLLNDGIVKLQGKKLVIEPDKKIFTRVVCSAFDDYFQKSLQTKHAKAV